MRINTLIVEDDDGLRSSLKKSFQRRHHEVLEASTVADANRLLSERKIDLLLLDMRLPDGTGLDVAAKVRDLDEEIVIIMMTAYPEVKTAVRAMKEGAQDFIIKPFELEELHLTVERAIEGRELRRKVRHLEHERQLRQDTDGILGESRAINRVREQISKVADAHSPVLVAGETGTGKELVADAIHRFSSRSAGPLVKVNCSAFSDQLLQSELFGHEKGAFTDAKHARPGLFEMADGGSLLLDEISEMQLDLQARLLRVVEGQSFRRIGGTREISTNVRVIATTNRDLQAGIRAGSFREDLYFRLKVFQIDVPPLRDRGTDVVLLAGVFLHRSAAALRKPPLRLAPEAEEILCVYEWPGNVRELRNVMERAAILAESGEVGAEHLPRELQASEFVRRHAAQDAADATMPSLRDIERLYAELVLKRVDGNLSEAARVLGIARNTLKAKIGSAGPEES